MATPSGIASATAPKKPTATRISDAAMWCTSTPSFANATVPSTTSQGPGKIIVPLTCTTAHQAAIRTATTRYGQMPEVLLGNLDLGWRIRPNEAVVHVPLVRHRSLQDFSIV